MKFVVFISGYGGNLQAIIDACQAGRIKSELALVFSNKRKAFGLERAQAAGIKTLALDPKDYTNPQSSIEGGIVEREASIHYSNVALYNTDTKKTDRVAYSIDSENNKNRVYFSSEKSID